LAALAKTTGEAWEAFLTKTAAQAYATLVFSIAEQCCEEAVAASALSDILKPLREFKIPAKYQEVMDSAQVGGSVGKITQSVIGFLMYLDSAIKLEPDHDSIESSCKFNIKAFLGQFCDDEFWQCSKEQKDSKQMLVGTASAKLAERFSRNIVRLHQFERDSAGKLFMNHLEMKGSCSDKAVLHFKSRLSHLKTASEYVGTAPLPETLLCHVVDAHWSVRNLKATSVSRVRKLVAELKLEIKKACGGNVEDVLAAFADQKKDDLNVALHQVAVQLETVAMDMASEETNAVETELKEDPLIKKIQAHLDNVNHLPSEESADAWAQKMGEKKGRLARKTCEYQSNIENMEKECAGVEKLSKVQEQMIALGAELKVVLWTYATICSLAQPCLLGDAGSGRPPIIIPAFLLLAGTLSPSFSPSSFTLRPFPHFPPSSFLFPPTSFLVPFLLFPRSSLVPSSCPPFPPQYPSPSLVRKKALRGLRMPAEALGALRGPSVFPGCFQGLWMPLDVFGDPRRSSSAPRVSGSPKEALGAEIFRGPLN